jgi:hypothetical protein
MKRWLPPVALAGLFFQSLYVIETNTQLNDWLTRRLRPARTTTPYGYGAFAAKGEQGAIQVLGDVDYDRLGEARYFEVQDRIGTCQ